MATITEVSYKPYGNYDVAVQKHRCFVPTKDKDGSEKIIPISQQRVVLKHKSGTIVTFKRFMNRKRWLWNDSRTGSVPERIVVDEIARMCFNKDVGQAAVFLATELAALSA